MKAKNKSEVCQRRYIGGKGSIYLITKMLQRFGGTMETCYY